MVEAETKPRKNVIVLGGGKFGCIALRRLKEKVLAAGEENPSAELRGLVGEHGAELVLGDALWAFEQIMEMEDAAPRWLMPAVPFHFAARWLLHRLAGRGLHTVPVPPELAPEVAMSQQGPEGQIYLSQADFMCPDDCPEPAAYCTVTRKPRGEPLFRLVEELPSPGWNKRVLRSHQLAPGVGCVEISDMLSLAEEMGQTGGKWLVATCCLCHGVLHGLSF